MNILFYMLMLSRYITCISVARALMIWVAAVGLQ